MTLGASVMPAAATAAATPPTFAMNLRRSVMTPPLAGDELVVGALGDVVPGADQRLELRVGRVDLPGHRALLRLLPDGLAGKLLELAQHGGRVLENFDLVLELRPQALEGDGILRVKVGQAVDHPRRRRHDRACAADRRRGS